MNKNIVIIGGGISGLTLAIALKIKGCNVIVVEKSTYNNIVSGEHVPAKITNIFENLNIPKYLITQNAIKCNGVMGNWGNNEIFNSGIFKVEGYDFILNRPDFEKTLYNYALSIGVIIHLGIKKVDFQKGCIKVENLHFTYDKLFDCTGRLSKFNESSRLIFDNLVGYSFRHANDHECNEASVIIESSYNGWWYAVNNSKETIFTFFTDRDIYKTINMMDELQNTLLINEKLKTNSFKVDFQMPCYTSIIKEKPLIYNQVGDSFSSFDPLSSQGIIKALQNVEFIANGNIQNLEEFYYNQRKQFIHYMNLRSKYYSDAYDKYKTEFYKRRILSN